MKTFILVAIAVMSSASFASERYLGQIKIKDGSIGMPMQSCDGPSDQVLESITLKISGEPLDLKRVSVRLEDSAGRSEMVPVSVRAGNYPVGSVISLSVPTNSRCVQNVLIVGNSQSARALRTRTPGRHGTRYRRIIRYVKPSVVSVYGDVNIR